MAPHLFQIPSFADERGVLTVYPFTDAAASGLPFVPRRAFWITDIPQGATRGSHAHRTCQEVVVAVHGDFFVRTLTERGERQEFYLTQPSEGLFVPEMTWCELHCFSPDAVCLCFCPEDYAQEGYIQTLEAFLEELRVKS